MIEVLEHWVAPDPDNESPHVRETEHMRKYGKTYPDRLFVRILIDGEERTYYRVDDDAWWMVRTPHQFFNPRHEGGLGGTNSTSNLGLSVQHIAELVNAPCVLLVKAAGVLTNE